MAKQNKWPRMSTPKVLVKWACIQKQEEWDGKPTGRFSIVGQFDDLEAQNAFMAELDKVYESFQKQGYFKEFKPKRGVPHNYCEKETDEGETTFKFSTQAVWPSGDPKVIPVFDAEGKPYHGPIGNGSKAYICFSVAPKTQSATNYGLKLMLEAIQVVDLKVFVAGNTSADAYGFAKQEGFSAANQGDNEDAPGNEYGFGQGNPEEAPEEAPF